MYSRIDAIDESDAGGSEASEIERVDQFGVLARHSSESFRLYTILLRLCRSSDRRDGLAESQIISESRQRTCDYGAAGSSGSQNVLFRAIKA